MVDGSPPIGSVKSKHLARFASPNKFAKEEGVLWFRGVAKIIIRKTACFFEGCAEFASGSSCWGFVVGVALSNFHRFRLQLSSSQRY